MNTIGVVAKKLGISVETIKFYERKTLIKQPIKPNIGYRIYDDAVINRIKFILKAKILGFTLNEISSLLALSKNCNDVKNMSIQKLVMIKQKIEDLQKLAKVIENLTKTCHSNKSSSTCPIIDALSKD